MTLAGAVCWAEIDLDAIAANIRSFKHHVGSLVEIFAVVKANAYGHGALAVSLAALRAGASRLAVHRLAEGIELRQAGLQAPILIMGYTPPAAAEQVVRWRLTPSLTTLEFALALSARAAAAGVTVPVHIKVDTGMNRFGLTPEETLPFLRGVIRLPSLAVEGLFTHFATADWADQTHTRQQLDIFQAVVAACRSDGQPLPLVHAANSAAAMRLPAAHLDAVRIGISMYGLLPSTEWPPVFPLQPALTLKSRVCRVRHVPAGSAVSYSRTYIAPAPTRIALVSVGYGDGFHRILSNQGSVLIHGQRAPILGRICMDQFVVDVTHIPDVCLEDEVVLVGQQGTDRLSAEDVALQAGTINYEVTTSLLSRVTRVYRRGGEISQVVSIGEG